MNLRRNKTVLNWLHKHPRVWQRVSLWASAYDEKKIAREYDKTPDVAEFVKSERARLTPTERWRSTYPEAYWSESDRIAREVNKLRSKTTVENTVNSSNAIPGIVMPDMGYIRSRDIPER